MAVCLHTDGFSEEKLFDAPMPSYPPMVGETAALGPKVSWRRDCPDFDDGVKVVSLNTTPPASITF
jgi:hypothetical protein